MKVDNTVIFRELSTDNLVDLEVEASTRHFSQRLSEDWIRSNVDTQGGHIAVVALEVDAQDEPPRPRHWRLLMLLRMRDGLLAQSLLDVMPESFLAIPATLSSAQVAEVGSLTKSTMTVADWERRSGDG